MTTATAVREAYEPGTSCLDLDTLHGWSDWAEWVEPVARSMAAVSSSVLADRIVRHFNDPIPPSKAFVLVMVDVGSSEEPPATAHAVRVATMVEIRGHFPLVDAVAAIRPSRYAVLARRHPGLSGTLRSLEERLHGEALVIESLARVWCEELPEGTAEIPAFVRGLGLKPAPLLQPERGELAVGYPVEVLAGRPSRHTDVAFARARRQSDRRGAVRSAAAAFVMAALVSSAAAATVGVSHLRPIAGRTSDDAASAGTRANQAPAQFSPDSQGLLGLFLPGLPASVLGDLSTLMQSDAEHSRALPAGPATPSTDLARLPDGASSAAPTPAPAPEVPGETPPLSPPPVAPPPPLPDPTPSEAEFPEAPKVTEPDTPEPEGLLRRLLPDLLREQPPEPEAPPAPAVPPTDV